MPPYRRIGLTVKSALEGKDEAVAHVTKLLQGLQCEVFIDAKRVEELPSARRLPTFEGGGIDLLLVIGGDGTILRAVRDIEDYSVPILSVNRGTVGFLAETELEDAQDLLPPLIRGEGMVDERSMLSVEAKRDGDIVFSGKALNEAVIAQGTIARIIDLPTTVNGEALTVYHADGLILATPTGSTAYSLAAGGPIVHPALKSATILTPINPYSFTQKPIVLKGDSVVEVTVQVRTNKFADTDVNLTVDGQVYTPLQNADTVRVQMAKETVKFVRQKSDTFLRTLRSKLRWGEGLER